MKKLLMLLVMFTAMATWAQAAEVAIISTNMGDMKIELSDKAPITVANFKSYAQKNYYDGTVFHRVIPGFMIQGGGFDQEMKKKPTDAPIKISPAISVMRSLARSSRG